MWLRIGILTFGLLGPAPAMAQVTNPRPVRSTVLMMPGTYSGETFNAMTFDPRADGLLYLWPRTAVEGGGGGTNGAGITNLNGITNASQTFATGTAGSDFAITSGGATHTFDLPTASGTKRGALSSADWNGFNNKQGAITVQTNGVTLAIFPTTWNFGPGLTGHVSGSTMVLGNSVAGGGDVTTAQLLYVSNQVQTASNALQVNVDSRQGGSAALTNLAGNPYVQYTNIAAFQGTNATLTDVAGIGATNKLVFTNDAWLTRMASNGVVVAAGSGISVASAGAGGRQTFTVTATGGGGWPAVDALASNITFESSATNATNLVVRQRVGQLASLLTVLDSNGAPVLELDSRGFLVVTNGLTNRAAAATNTIALGAADFGSFTFPTWTEENGLTFAAQPGLFQSRLVRFLPSSGSTIFVDGAAVTTTGGTSISHPNPNEFLPYMWQLSTPNTSNASASAFTSVDMINIGTRTPGNNGFFFSVEWASTNGLFNNTGGGHPRLFIGGTSTASPNLTNLVTTTNATGQYLGLFASPRDASEMWISARDGTAEFRTNIAMNCAATNLFRFQMMAPPMTRFIRYQVENLTLNTSVSGWFSNNVPTNFMKFGMALKNSTNVVQSVLGKLDLHLSLSAH